MNKQEAIEKIESSLMYENTRHIGKAVNIYDVIDIINQIDELEKPVVPKFVADWYEEYKNDFEYNLYRLCINFHERKLHEDLHEWFDNDKNKPIEVLVLMNKYGYEVEKEKLYTVELPNPNAGGHVVLCKTSDGIVSITFASIARWRGGKNVRLTEAEIKKDFNWAWQFAKEVEE